MACVATSSREKKIKMMVRSFLAGAEPEEKLKEVVLEEHLGCGCECSKEVTAKCTGRLNIGTCQCECGGREYEHARLVCGMRGDMYWDYEACQCISKSVVPRRVEDQLGCGCHPVSGRKGNRALDIAGGVFLGFCLALVVILAAATWHYRSVVDSIKLYNLFKYPPPPSSKIK